MDAAAGRGLGQHPRDPARRPSFTVRRPGTRFPSGLLPRQRHLSRRPAGRSHRLRPGPAHHTRGGPRQRPVLVGPVASSARPCPLAHGRGCRATGPALRRRLRHGRGPASAGRAGRRQADEQLTHHDAYRRRDRPGVQAMVGRMRKGPNAPSGEMVGGCVRTH